MKLLFVCRKFDRVVGGVERMAVMLMNAMCERGHQVSLLTWDRANAEPYYPMDSRIRWHCLDMGDPMVVAGWGLRLARMARIRSLAAWERPDVVIAFQHGPFMTVRLAVLGLGLPVIAAERNAPSRFDHTRAGRHRKLLFQTFRLAAKVTVQLESYKDDYPAYLRPRIVTIPNPVQPAAAFATPSGRPGGPKTLLTVGRLSYQKNQEVLVRAFACLATDFPDWRLRIVGDGEDHAKLERLVGELGIASRVDLAGPVRDVSAEYVAAHLFCLPSLWEGFPNALAEALTHGLPAVGFRGCSGVNELIRPGENGLLVDDDVDDGALSKALRSLMLDGQVRATLGREATKISEDDAPDGIFARWQYLFESVTR